MSDRRYGPQRPDSDEVRRLLHRAASSHQPDTEWILERVEQARRGHALGRSWRSPLGGHRPGWDVPLAWAAAAALLVVGVATVQQLPEAASGVVTATPAAPASPVEGVDPGPSPAETRPTTSHGPGRSPTTAPSGSSGASGSSGVGATRERSRSLSPSTSTHLSVTGAPVLHLTPLASGSELSLPRSGDRDWTIVGARKDGTTIRAKAGTGEIDDVSTVGASASVAPGPLRISWSGGMPEQDRTGASTWRTVLSGNGHQQVVVRLREPGTIDLVIGVVGLPASSPGTVSATVTSPDVGQGTGGRTASLIVPPSAGAAIVSVQVPDVTPDTTVTITLRASERGGQLAVAAVAVR